MYSLHREAVAQFGSAFLPEWLHGDGYMVESIVL